jgi:hypothetical protein
LISAFNTKIEYLQEEADHLKANGVDKEIFSNVNNYSDDQVVNEKILEETNKRFPLAYINKISDQACQAFWLAHFRNRSSVTVDDFAYALSMLSQIGSRSLDNFYKAYEQLLAKASSLDYELNLSKDDNVKLVEKLYEIAGVEVEEEEKDLPADVDLDNIPTKATIGGKKVNISVVGYNIGKLRQDFKKLKGEGSIISLRVKETPTSPEEGRQDLHLKEKTFRAPAGQALITIGDNLENDIILLKTGVTFGTTIAVLQKGGHLYVKDTSVLTLKYDSLIKVQAEKTVPLKVGNILNLGSALVYGITSLSPNVTWEFLGELKPAAKPYENQAEASTPNDGDVSIGRLKKNKVTIAHSSLSGAHCIIKADSITDANSSNGTYIYMRTLEQSKQGAQSDFVPFDKGNMDLALFGYNFEL